MRAIDDYKLKNVKYMKGLKTKKRLKRPAVWTTKRTPSLGALMVLSTNRIERLQITSWTPIDPPFCSCIPIVEKERRVSVMEGRPAKYIKCPESKSGRSKHRIYCKHCGEGLASFYGKTAELSDYVDLHYVCEYDEDGWYGCLGVNIHPVTSELRFECCCGNKPIAGRFTEIEIK